MAATSIRPESQPESSLVDDRQRTSPPGSHAPASGPSSVTHVEKPWGREIIWAHTETYVGKILHVKAGCALSVQYHREKDETVYLLSGEMRYWVQLPGFDELQDQRLGVGDAFRIRPGTIHYIEAITDCNILEASTPHLNDVVRLQDRYGREGTSSA